MVLQAHSQQQRHDAAGGAAALPQPQPLPPLAALPRPYSPTMGLPPESPGADHPIPNLAAPGPLQYDVLEEDDVGPGSEGEDTLGCVTVASSPDCAIRLIVRGLWNSAVSGVAVGLQLSRLSVCYGARPARYKRFQLARSI